MMVPALRSQSKQVRLKKGPGHLQSSVLLRLSPASTAEHLVLAVANHFPRLWKTQLQPAYDMQTTEFPISWQGGIIPDCLVRWEEKSCGTAT